VEIGYNLHRPKRSRRFKEGETVDRKIRQILRITIKKFWADENISVGVNQD